MAIIINLLMWIGFGIWFLAGYQTGRNSKD
jgi:hypothetical protein